MMSEPKQILTKAEIDQSGWNLDSALPPGWRCTDFRVEERDEDIYVVTNVEAPPGTSPEVHEQVQANFIGGFLTAMGGKLGMDIDPNDMVDEIFKDGRSMDIPKNWITE